MERARADMAEVFSLQVIVGSLVSYHRVADSLRRFWADFVKDAKLKVKRGAGFLFSSLLPLSFLLPNLNSRGQTRC